MTSLSPRKVYQGDCIELMKQIESGSIDLVFADPPFNIGYEYDEYDDRQDDQKYLDWSKEWIAQAKRILKPNGTFWLAIGDEYAAELKMIAQRELGFHCRSWVIWYYTFGVNCVRGFSRSHTHIFHFVKDQSNFTFNSENHLVRVPSARQLVYADSRANPKGRLPDNTWFHRPQDIPEGFQPQHDTWYFSRVAGTFKEREGFHGCQMPEQLLGRIIRLSSNPHDIVFDPFGGSGTTAVVAKKLGRQWMATELSEDYAKRIHQRLDKTNAGDQLDGVSDASKSSPKTSEGRKRVLVFKNYNLPRPVSDEATIKGVIRAYKQTSRGYSTDYLLCNADLNGEFIEACKKDGLMGNPHSWNILLIRTRKQGKLPRSKKASPRMSFTQMDAYSDASEIAMRMMELEYKLSLDDVLCWPEAAAEFDKIAKLYAPEDVATFDLRWAALAIRKRSSKSKQLAGKDFKDWLSKKLPPRKELSNYNGTKHDVPGVYIVEDETRQPLYVGESLNLRERIEGVIASEAWGKFRPRTVRVLPFENETHGLQSSLVHRSSPLLNTQLLIDPSLQKQLA